MSLAPELSIVCENVSDYAAKSSGRFYRSGLWLQMVRNLVSQNFGSYDKYTRGHLAILSLPESRDYHRVFYHSVFMTALKLFKI